MPRTYAVTATTSTVSTHERHDRDELGDQQPGAADRSHQHVAQRALLGLAGDRLARGDRHRDRQEQRQHDAERRQREQRAVGQHRGQERRPGAGPRAEVGDREQHRDQRRQRRRCSAMVTQVRRLRTQLDQLDADHWPAPIDGRTPNRSALSVGRGASTTSSRVCRSAPSLVDPDPGLHQPRVERGRVGSRTRSRCAVVLLHDPVEQPPDLLDVGRVHLDPAGGPAQLVELGLQDEPAAVEDADAGAQLLDLAEQVAGQEHRRARPG